MQFACSRRLHLHGLLPCKFVCERVTQPCYLPHPSRDARGGIPIISCEQTLLICSRLPSPHAPTASPHPPPPSLLSQLRLCHRMLSSPISHHRILPFLPSLRSPSFTFHSFPNRCWRVLSVSAFLKFPKSRISFFSKKEKTGNLEGENSFVATGSTFEGSVAGLDGLIVVGY